LNEGELEVGQVSAQLNAITTAKDVVDTMMKEYNALATSNFQRY